MSSSEEIGSGQRLEKTSNTDNEVIDLTTTDDGSRRENKRTFNSRVCEVIDLTTEINWKTIFVSDNKIILRKELGSKPRQFFKASYPSCTVCFERFYENLKSMATPCSHLYCDHCLRTVANVNKRCAVCNSDVQFEKCMNIYL